MKTHDILQSKGYGIHTIRPDATLADVVDKLVEHNCGSLLVVDKEQLQGIITERDILRTLASEERPLKEIAVYERMTTEVVTASSQDEVNEVMGTLTERRIRHLPIVDGSDLRGIISIGDVVKAQHDELTVENHFLKSYIINS